MQTKLVKELLERTGPARLLKRMDKLRATSDGRYDAQFAQEQAGERPHRPTIKAIRY